MTTDREHEESPFDASEPVQTPEQQQGDWAIQKKEGAKPLTIKPEVLGAISEFGKDTKQPAFIEKTAGQTVFTRKTEEAKRWTAMEANMHEHYKTIIEQIMGGARETLDEVAQKVFDAYMHEEDKNIKIVLADMQAQSIPPERAERMLQHKLEDSPSPTL